ncbi:hypothetical protein ACFQZC_05225 [Streptacidiphilus monticola]
MAVVSGWAARAIGGQAAASAAASRRSAAVGAGTSAPPAPTAGTQRGQHPAAADQSPCQVVHAGEPAQRRAERHVLQALTREVRRHRRVAGIVELAEQLGGLGGGQQQARHRPRGRHRRVRRAVERTQLG